MDVLTLDTEVLQNSKRWLYVDIKKKKLKKNPKKKPKSSIQSKHCITLHWLIYNYLSEPERVCNSFWNPKVWHPSVHPSVIKSCSGWEDADCECKHEKLWNSGVWDCSVQTLTQVGKQRGKPGKVHGEAALGIVLYPQGYLYRLWLLLRVYQVYSWGCLLITVRSGTAWDRLAAAYTLQQHNGSTFCLPCTWDFQGTTWRASTLLSLPSCHITKTPHS